MRLDERNAMTFDSSIACSIKSYQLKIIWSFSVTDLTCDVTHQKLNVGHYRLPLMTANKLFFVVKL